MPASNLAVKPGRDEADDVIFSVRPLFSIHRESNMNIRGGQSGRFCAGSDFGFEAVLGIILFSRTGRKCRTGAAVKPPLETAVPASRFWTIFYTLPLLCKLSILTRLYQTLQCSEPGKGIFEVYEHSTFFP